MALDIAPDLETKIVQRAAAEGITPDQLLERWLDVPSLHNGAGSDDGEGDFGGKSVYEMFSDLIGTGSFEPTDLGRRAEEYLAQGFGETRSSRKAQP